MGESRHSAAWLICPPPPPASLPSKITGTCFPYQRVQRSASLGTVLIKLQSKEPHQVPLIPYTTGIAVGCGPWAAPCPRTFDTCLLYKFKVYPGCEQSTRSPFFSLPDSLLHQRRLSLCVVRLRRIDTRMQISKAKKKRGLSIRIPSGKHQNDLDSKQATHLGQKSDHLASRLASYKSAHYPQSIASGPLSNLLSLGRYIERFWPIGLSATHTRASASVEGQILMAYRGFNTLLAPSSQKSSSCICHR